MNEKEIELLLDRPTLKQLDELTRNEIRVAAREYPSAEPSYDDPKLEVERIQKEVNEFSKAVLQSILSKYNERQRLASYKNQKNAAVRKLKWSVPIVVCLIVFVFLLTFKE